MLLGRMSALHSRRRATNTAWKAAQVMATARWSVLLLLLQHVLQTQASGIFARDRENAFIGYQEVMHGNCRDNSLECGREAAINSCLTNPYLMRKACPISCNVEPCASSGTALVGHFHPASADASQSMHLHVSLACQWPHWLHPAWCKS